MKIETLIKFYEDNDVELVKEYQNKVDENIKTVSSITKKYFMYCLIIIFLYYLLKESALTSVKIGIIEIKNLKTITIFTPLLFVIFLFMALVSEFRRDNLINQSKILFNLRANLVDDPDWMKRNHFNDFNLSCLPFYIMNEIVVTIKNGFWDTFFLIIYSIINMIFSIGLYCFQIYVLFELFELWNVDFSAKLVFIITCMLVFLSFYFSIKITLRKIKRL